MLTQEELTEAINSAEEFLEPTFLDNVTETVVDLIREKLEPGYKIEVEPGHLVNTAYIYRNDHRHMAIYFHPESCQISETHRDTGGDLPCWVEVSRGQHLYSDPNMISQLMEKIFSPCSPKGKVNVRFKVG